MPDGLNFVNCFNARGEKRSGVAFYNSIGEQNVGQQPQDFEYTDTNGLTTWESSNVKSKFKLLLKGSPKFPLAFFFDIPQSQAQY